MFRTHKCNELRSEHIGQTITLSGWVHRRRDHGDIIFVDLRDRYGLTQIQFDPSVEKSAHTAAEDIRTEWVLKVTGTVEARPEGQANPNMETGDVELIVKEVEILNKAKTPPFEIDIEHGENEEVRLKHRYLDLRRERMAKNIKLRHDITTFCRNFLDQQEFLEIETPILIKGTPEGSREYLVPSRLHHGDFYVLPQSPQQLKQMLMVAGMDKYFQVARCFRDEDQRGDRQPEFTQLDIEASFVEQEDILNLSESLALALTKKFLPNKTIQTEPFQRITYDEAMNKYGSDKPDLRFDLTIVDITEIAKTSGFGVFKSVANSNGGVVKAICIKGGASFTRKDIDDLTRLAQDHGAKGLAYIQCTADAAGPVIKNTPEEEQKAIKEAVGAKDGDIIFFGADTWKNACEALGAVRLDCAKRLNMIDENLLSYLWVTDFPMFEKNEEGQLAAQHHPFTCPQTEDIEKLESSPEAVKSIAYDLVLNGNELGGGSIRIHDRDLQDRVFKAMGIGEEEMQAKFGHILKAFEYGAPPHGGIAFGMDRIVMLFAGEPNIREVIAFPKNNQAMDLMLNAPAPMPEKELNEANITVLKQEE